MHKRVCFQSNQEGHSTPANGHVRTCELQSQSDVEESLYANLGPAKPMTFIVCLVCLCFYVGFLGGLMDDQWLQFSLSQTHTHFKHTVNRTKEHHLGLCRQKEPIIFV